MFFPSYYQSIVTPDKTIEVFITSLSYVLQTNVLTRQKLCHFLCLLFLYSVPVTVNNFRVIYSVAEIPGLTQIVHSACFQPHYTYIKLNKWIIYIYLSIILYKHYNYTCSYRGTNLYIQHDCILVNINVISKTLKFTCCSTISTMY